MKRILLKSLCALLFITTLSKAQLEEDEKSSSSFNLFKGTISVTIGGSFIVNGSFAAMPTERVDQFITRIFNETKVQKVKENALSPINEILKEKDFRYADRNILLKRVNGESIILDLKKFRLNGDFINNPYLKNDDVIVFSPLDMERNFVSIMGAVNNPNKFQYVENDKLSDAIEFAQGLNKAYEKIEKVEITRLSYDGQKDNTITLNVNDNVLLQRGDRIRVIADETSKRDFTVLVLGEVNIPGNIPITKNNSTLKEVIEKTGGFKSSADLIRTELIRGSTLFSNSLKQIQSLPAEQKKEALDNLYTTLVLPEIKEDFLMQRMSYLTEEDTLYFKIDDQLRLLRGNAAINFREFGKADSNIDSFIVNDGDIIIVPEKNDLVYVFGQVPKTGYIMYEKGKDYNYYIQLAGGLGQEAKDELFVIKGKTRNWIRVDEDKKVEIEPGDFIWVPKKTPKDFKYYVNIITPITSVVGTLVTIAILIVQVTKK
jgi:protein involved in polysaccharide export with SLBB domain